MIIRPVTTAITTNARARKPRVGAEAVAASLLLCGMLALGIWVFSKPPAPQAEAFETVVADASPTASPASLCGDIERIAVKALHDHSGLLHLTLYATGDRASGELTRLGAIERTPKRALMEQRDDAGDERGLVARVGGFCAALPAKNESPIFRAVSAAVVSLSPSDCGAPGKSCRVWVRTDGIEEEDRAVMTRLRGAKARSGDPSGRIDNRAVSVVFCGIVQRSLGRHAGRAPSLADVAAAFRPEFTNPDRVRFLPSCEPGVVDEPPANSDPAPAANAAGTQPVHVA